MSTIKADNIQSGDRVGLFPISEIRGRVIKSYRNTYRNGSWNPSDSYAWVPGCWVDYIPLSASSRIRCTINLSKAFENTHHIGNFIFYANGVEQGRHSISGHHHEAKHMYMWDFASWGTTNGRIGYQARRHGGGNIPRFHGTHYWDGGGSNQVAQSQMFIEEYIPLS